MSSPLAPVAIGRVGSAGAERPVILIDGVAFEASRLTDDITPGFIEEGGIERLVEAARQGSLEPADLTGVRIGAPVSWPPKVLGIGLNYRRHAAETAGMATGLLVTSPILGGERVSASISLVRGPRGSRRGGSWGGDRR